MLQLGGESWVLSKWSGRLLMMETKLRGSPGAPKPSSTWFSFRPHLLPSNILLPHYITKGWYLWLVSLTIQEVSHFTLLNN